MPSNSPPPSTGAPTTGNVVALDPLGERRRPGRPRSIIRAPTEVERARHQLVAERLRRHVEADPLVRATSAPTDRASPEAFDAAMREIAREAAGLLRERRQAQFRSRPEAAKIASRRISALERLAGLLLERLRLGPDERVEPQDPKVRKIVALFMTDFRECAFETLSAADAEKFTTAYEEKVRGWEDRVG
jgi:hypothetical protein